MRLSFCTLILSCLLSAPVLAQIPLNPARIDAFVTRIMDSASIPGLSIAIIRNGKLAYSKGYGLTKSDSTQRVNAATVFDAASLSKPVFAYAALQLVEEGKLDLDKPLFEYLPYPDVAADERYKKITARMALSHQSGFPNWRRNRRSNQLDMKFDPGAHFGYSGEGFVYLQRVVEKITGQPMQSFMAERVFTPLRMTRSSYVWQPAFDDNYALPHDNFGQPESKGKPRDANSAYSLQTTADDYARFILALLTPTGLKPATVRQMVRPQIRLPKQWGGSDSLSTGLYWGLGLGLEKTSTGTYGWHWGDNGTYKCYVAVDPGAKNAVVYFTNSFNGLSLAETITTQFIGGIHPAIDFLDYGSYKDPSLQFTRQVLHQRVSDAIKPYRKPDGQPMLTEDQLSWIGHQLIRIGRVDDALEIFRLNTEAHPQSAEAFYNLAYAQLNQGNWPGAINALEKALQLKTDYDDARQLLTSLKDTQQAQGTGKTRLVLSGYPNAHLVSLAGSFNDWHNLRTFFLKKGDIWECYLDLKPGTYPYKIIVDGKWMTDPANPATQQDEQGNVNSVLTVK